ncbi:MAG: hypothetical protein HY553_03910 [Elusimicrobia bacterium]|nr:hypothetical protein [Elusimicrobiota bacterium]
MTPSLRLVTVALAALYFTAAAYHSGLVIAAGALAPASIAEALLGLVLLAAVANPVRASIAYVVVLAGTLFGLAIVVARGPLGIDLAIHVVMLLGLVVAFAMLLWSRRASA